jgi:alkanesulfonate monooxygenase SsuD/methylene tetrahydromethanopterin reductase-like flavin-dependent oxidoreductase (luciferase family)
MPAPNLIAAALARRTTRARICILGNALPLRDHPLRIAEEVAMLDVISGGRVISGFVRGIGAEYHSFALNPFDSRDRFIEAHDLIVKAWTTSGPFAFEGTHYRLRYVNPWPRPLQQPHPPIWVPSQGSGETIEWAAQRRYTYMQTYTPALKIKPFYDEYRRVADESGYTAGAEQLGWAVPIYVAETDDRAREEAAPHLDYFFNKLIRMPPEFIFPYGYLTEASEPRVLQGKRGYTSGGRTLQSVEADALALVGSPATVRQQLEHWQRVLGFGVLIAFLHFGSLPTDLTRKNLELFASQVMPKMRPIGEPGPSA